MITTSQFFEQTDVEHTKPYLYHVCPSTLPAKKLSADDTSIFADR